MEGKNKHREFIRLAIKAARENIGSSRGGPFGAVVVKDGKVIATASNEVLGNNDPTAHAEVVAIRRACKVLNDFQLTGCTLYASCEPCPMCLGAIYWARPDAVYFAASREDAAEVGFDDNFIYEQIPLPIEKRSIPTSRLLPEEARLVFREWDISGSKIPY